MKTALLILICASSLWARTYTSSFAAPSENPLSETGNWTNGGTTGLDWKNCRKTSGLAFGTQTGSDTYQDSTCIVAGSWGNDETVQATVHIVTSDATQFEEVELRLRTTVSAHFNYGYEVNCSVKTGYMQVIRWENQSGSGHFTQIGSSSQGCVDGDVIKATITGSTITVYKNGSIVQMDGNNTVTDSTFATGSPGIGFYIQNGTSGTNADFGFSSFTATDGVSTVPTVTTTTATAITTNSASAGGNVTDDGGASVTARGTCYATTANPTTPCTSDGSGTGAFTSSLTSLLSSTLYHYRAFATNSVGTAYGSDLTFTTLSNTAPMVQLLSEVEQ